MLGSNPMNTVPTGHPDFSLPKPQEMQGIIPLDPVFCHRFMGPSCEILPRFLIPSPGTNRKSRGTSMISKNSTDFR